MADKVKEAGNGGLKLRYKIWFDSNGKAFGEGPFLLLRQVRKTGSLHQAAIQMKMSYRKAWVLLHAVEKRLGFPLLTRRVGGVAGGGSELTEEANRFMDRYEAFRNEADEALQAIYKKHFTE
jgi:molybdate transport system regulatory protein